VKGYSWLKFFLPHPFIPAYQHKVLHKRSNKELIVEESTTTKASFLF